MNNTSFRLILSALILLTVARADDLRLADGRVLKDVTIKKIDVDGVVIAPQKFGPSVTKYQWKFIHPEDIPKLREEGERMRKDEGQAKTITHPEAGPKPEQLEDGVVPELDRRIRRWLKDPDSLIYEGWSPVTLARSPGGNPAWLVTVTYRAKNSYGGYTGNKSETYWYDAREKFWKMIIR